ncbi:MAG: glycoside hydrolase family 3 C-terminal domain-containing protein [Clostridium sp.]|nr:glycoside hydrolase family 3 C-terminal domain-containing protein [Clostridium sp.]
MNKYELDLNKYARLAREAAAEGCVLLENKNNALPLRKGDKIAVYGRSAFNYYKSGLGSGGLVNTRYVVGILDALKSCGDIALDEKLCSIYEEWIKENPYDEGKGWGQVPWAQKEMPVTEEMLEAADRTDAALVIIGRTAGEDQDNHDTPGSYRLTDVEEDLIARVCKASKRVIVVLNVGNIIDMSWVKKYRPDAVLYAWQGGQEGGNGVLDALIGKVNPCGKLTDTIAEKISDYPSDKNFGSEEKNVYQEDIYVGYRYFETFAKEKVLYPFGYGLSYTTFAVKGVVEEKENSVQVTAEVTNTGKLAGKEVVQVYVKTPAGKLGNPARKLAGFAKTQVIPAGEKETVVLEIPKYDYASYDDSGATGNKSCYVLEEGLYEFYVGGDVRSAGLAGSYEQPFRVMEKLQEAYAPTESFERMKAVEQADGSYAAVMETVPTRTVNPRERLIANRPAPLPYTGDKGYRLADVLDGKVGMDEFVAQISDEELICMFRGEGMCSPRVTPGIAAAFGGVTPELEKLGIPAAGCSDGPSGIRMDCGTKAFSMPNGTALGCSFNLPLIKALYEMAGQELRLNKIDSLLGPGMNIHRHPLNGRNFEYISEDPYLTGKVCAAQLLGMDTYGIAGTVKHFCGNNQETARRKSDSEISERALREIYLKGFEIAVKEGKCRSVMTTYASVNGLWTAGSYDLNTTILRGEWGFEGIVMTDWWADANYEGEAADHQVKAPMLAAQNDLYMVTSKPADNPENDDMQRKLEEGYITRGELQRGAKNILGFILKSPAILHKTGRIDPEELAVMDAKGDNDISPTDLVYYQADENNEIVIDGSLLHPKAGESDVFGIQVEKFGTYSITLTMSSDLGPLAQLPVSVYYDNALKAQISIQGTEGNVIEEKRDLGVVFGSTHFIKLYYGANGIQIQKAAIRLEAELEKLW